MTKSRRSIAASVFFLVSPKSKGEIVEIAAWQGTSHVHTPDSGGRTLVRRTLSRSSPFQEWCARAAYLVGLYPKQLEMEIFWYLLQR